MEKSIHRNLNGVAGATATELSLLSGFHQVRLIKAGTVIYGSNGEVNATTLQIAGSSITAAASDINKLTGLTSSTTDLNRSGCN